jgi:hypothetical protein
VDKLIQLLTELTPIAGTFLPGAGAAPEIVAAVANLIKYIKEQSGMTTDQILARAGVTLDDNERMLLEDEIRLGG